MCDVGLAYSIVQILWRVALFFLDAPLSELSCSIKGAGDGFAFFMEGPYKFATRISVSLLKKTPIFEKVGQINGMSRNISFPWKGEI